MKRTNLLLVLFSIFTSSLFLINCQQKQVTPTAPEGFEIHPEFKMELVAAEPIIFDPVDMKFDEKGRAFVLEMPGYPFSKDASRIILLQDKNKDGQYNERIVFAKDLGVASSFMPYKGGFLVAAPPDLIWLKDTNGDNKADEKEAIMSGFEVGNLQHNYNGLTYGLDNWIYAANGGNNGAPYFTETPNNSLDLREQDFRFRLENKILERVGQSSGGFELAFDNWGNMYETHNLQHVSQLVFPNYYIEELPVEPSHSLTIISDHEENGLSRIYPIGEQETRVNHPEQSGYFSGSCGITFYGGNAFPKGFNNNLFVCDVVLNLIHLDILSPNKAAFKTSRKREKADFIASSNRSFRPVNMTTGPDGAMYLMDMHRAVIEHPEWIPDEMEKELDLKAGMDKGRIYKITPKSNWLPANFNLDQSNSENLVAALADKNQWTRMTAQRLIVEFRDNKYVPLLEKLLQNSPNDLATLHALWTLEGLNSLKKEAILTAFNKTTAGLKVNALKIAELRLNENPDLILPIIGLIADENARVQMQAALTLGTLNAANYQKNQADITNALSKILQEKDLDSWTAMAVASAAKQQNIPFVKNILQSNATLNDAQQQVLLTLTRLIGKSNNALEAQQLLIAILNNSTIENSQKSAIIDALAKGWKTNETVVKNNKLVLPTLTKIESTKHPAIIHACGNLRQVMNLPVSIVTKQQIAIALREIKDNTLSLENRKNLLQLIELERFSKRANILYGLLDNREPLVLQEAALWQLWRSNNTSVAPKLVELWPTLGPEARKKASDILLYKSFNHKTLLTALEEGKINMGEMNFDLERRRTLLWWSDTDEIKRRAAALFSDAGVVTRKAAIEKMRPSLNLAGDLAKGKEQFINLCSQCHQYGEIGKDVGPVLTEISRKSKESLLHDILDPNAAVDTKYINHQAKTKDGNIYTGIIVQETDTEIVLKMMGGQETNLFKKDIEQLSSLGTSMMPEGQEANLTEQDMADLLAFLQQSTL